MPRRQFIADLQKAQDSALPLGIHDLQTGEDDGQFEFLITNSTTPGAPIAVKVTALVLDLGDYPASHEYMVYSGEDAPSHVAHALQSMRRTNGKNVFELLDIVATSLARLSPQADGDTLMPDSQFDNDMLEDDDDNDEDEDDVYDSDHEAFQTTSKPFNTGNLTTSVKLSGSLANKGLRDRIRSDILVAKQAGFKVGVLGPVMSSYNAFLSISIRMSKLGISEEAMQAWQVEASEYLMLILQYPNGYKHSEELQALDSLRLDSNIGMRVCAGKRYKPTIQDAIKAFSTAKNQHNKTGGNQLPNSEEITDDTSIRDTFISKPLNGLLRERLVPILRFRGLGMGWRGAEDLYLSRSSAGAGKSDVIEDCYFKPEAVEQTDALPAIVKADHYAAKSVTQHSFPLLAMQFLLRHFVRCTEFCLVCHRRMNTDLEAIKPYVCDSELCLYQYMALGFGPSTEHDISAQPYMVDLLVSFCYNSASAGRLKDFPDGLSLIVPPADETAVKALEARCAANRYGRQQPQDQAKQTISRSPASSFDIGIDRERNEIIFFTAPDICPVRTGDWIVIKTAGTLEGSELHCRVSETTYYPTISINKPIDLTGTAREINQSIKPLNEVIEKPSVPKPVHPATPPKWAHATFQVYRDDFKNLSQSEKCVAICKLLDTLPNVKTIQDHVIKRSSADLKNWVERISPSALSLLRWIIASNRACIMQVDGDGDGTATPRKEERLSGMKDWMQFRFAMGAPDKEQRFINEVRKTTDRLGLQYPTLFAWHGSPLYNWHMIIREGLHYNNMDHGRAYGNGVYHATDASISTGYSGMSYVMNGGAAGNPGQWPNSLLRVSSALALNEIVNAPSEFTSHHPYYVVHQLDWIQTRYLFVQCAPTVDSIKVSSDVQPQNTLRQDPVRIPKGVSGSIKIPASAIKASRFVKDGHRPDTPKNPVPLKKLKAGGGFDDPIPIDDNDNESVATDISDLNILIEEEPELTTQVVVTKASINASGPPTDFVPGSLDFAKLPLMPLPTYATSGTTKRLMKELQAIAKVRDSTPLADLGWYIDIEKIENVYQWIVELHSFHTFEIKGKKLPLAEDMKKKGVKSVVLEIRYNKDFPFTPPYVRVIRPRFLSLAQGGGGHIVLGGAMCMELLTNTGWSSVSSMESVLMQIRMAIASEPFARLDIRSTGDYGTGEAADGYIRACRTHGWEIPPGFQEMAYGSGTAASSSGV